MQTSNLIPTKNRIIVQIFEPELALIKTGGDVVSDPRTRIQVLAVGPMVEGIKPGDYVLLQPEANVTCPKNIAQYGMEGKIGTCYDTVVVAVINEPKEADYPKMFVENLDDVAND